MVRGLPRQGKMQQTYSQPWKRVKRSLPWYPFILVNVIVLVVFSVIPLAGMFDVSLYSWDMLGPRDFVGLGNYARMLGDPILAIALKNTLVYTLEYVPLVVLGSLCVAILVNRPLIVMKFFRSLYYLPCVTSEIVTGIVFWRLFLPHPNAPANRLLALVGIGPQDWLVSLKLAMPTVVGVNLWGSFGYYMIIWLAALQSVPSELYDAAKVDGASGWRLHWHITLPMLRPTLAFVLVISTMNAIKVFGSIYVLTQGGPVHATTTLTWYIYSQAFNFARLGYASAISVLSGVLIILIGYIQVRSSRFSQEVF